MKVEVLYFEGCPNHAPTVDRVREELQSDGLPKEIREVEVRTQAEAEALGFLGSPTVRIDGLDIEREARNLTNYGMSCRTYLEGRVRSGLPSPDLIRRALDEQITQAGGGTSFKSHDSCCQIRSAPSTALNVNLSGTSATQSSRAGSVALFSGGLAAILASTCCLGPLVLVTLGISGAWIGNLTRLAPYQPYILAATLACLGYGYWRVYRATSCAEGEACAAPLPNRFVKVGLLVATVLVIAALGLDLLAPFFADL